MMLDWVRTFISSLFPEPESVSKRVAETEQLNGASENLRNILDRDPCADLPQGWECPPSWEDMLEVDKAYRERHG